MKNKILFITPLPPPVHGSSMMSQYIKESKLINDTFDCDFINLSTSRKMDEIGKMSLAKVWRFCSSYFLLIGKLLFRRYDLCYLAITCHGIGFLKDAPFVLICKLFRKKVVIHQHNKGMSGYVDKPFYKWLLPFVYRKTHVILLSWKLYPDIERVVSKEQVLICPNGIPEVWDEKPLFNRNNNIPKLLFLSNLIESKGVLVLLDACHILKEKSCLFTCEFVGGETKEINKEDMQREIDKRGLNEIVSYVGSKYKEEKREVLKRADIFIFPTFYINETFGLVNLEAMQYGLPIISTDVGGITDIVIDGETGLICKTRDAEDLANKIKLLLDNPSLRQQYGQAGYDRFVANYTLERFEACMSACLSIIA
ncbi:glycosyltransferase involved in cell wall biosynthesis [Parabacteroides sp. PFB2-12]|uniref:glycosyltransferase family 4 protein n=1 Tax=unclassified Parabacteroides TaxID=2649774 RepID=UPI002474EBBD|nr:MULTISPECIES: glycosyltransferase family 4 protein [unclassified Parabacteroides]MDH6342257.1 glycosyltransferase involved in cell wall biosynthesis [Parabacteroides sp. PM6-13]MDH6390600.1 glycosyltransferase involved in cell wall biosynthesis [Parabacteroides sp. PFB2-12]